MDEEVYAVPETSIFPINSLDAALIETRTIFVDFQHKGPANIPVSLCSTCQSLGPSSGVTRPPHSLYNIPSVWLQVLEADTVGIDKILQKPSPQLPSHITEHAVQVFVFTRTILSQRMAKSRRTATS